MIKSLIKKVPFIFKPLKLIHSHLSHERHRFQQLACILRSRNTLILSTMPRAGSHYLQMLLANYWNIEYLKNNKRMGFLDIKRDIWNSEFDKTAKNFTLKKQEIHKELDFNDLVFEHYNPFIPYYNCKKMIFLYRNPFDNILSRFYFFHVNRNKKNEKIHSLSDAVKFHLPSFVKQYKQMKKMELKNNVILVAYEDLISKPDQKLTMILKFLGQRVNGKSIYKAVNFSETQHIVNDEKKNYNSKDIIGNNQQSSFIRNPKVGQWREHYKSYDIDYIKEHLAAKSISIDEFIT